MVREKTWMQTSSIEDCALPGDIKIIAEEQDRVIEIIHKRFN